MRRIHTHISGSYLGVRCLFYVAGSFLCLLYICLFYLLLRPHITLCRPSDVVPRRTHRLVYCLNSAPCTHFINDDDDDYLCPVADVLTDTFLPRRLWLARRRRRRIWLLCVVTAILYSDILFCDDVAPIRWKSISTGFRHSLFN